MTTWPDRAAAQLLAELTAKIDHQLTHAQALRRELHRHPDLSGAERPTADRLRRELPGLKATRVADTGFFVRLGPPGPAVVVRSELDALPLTEQTGVSWAAADGAMHACGAEAVLGSGTLAAEEVVAVIGAHVQPRVAPGVVSTGPGAVNAAADRFEIVIHGHPGHGAYPHVTIDPVPVAAAIITGLQELIGRTIDPLHPALISVGRLEAGTAANIIPATARMEGVIRTMDEADRTHLQQSIRRLAEHTAAARGARAEVTITIGDPVLSNDRRLVRFTDSLISHLGLPLAHEPFRSCGADDFSHYSAIAPIMMAFVGVHQDPTVRLRHRSDALARQEIGLHHPEFLPSEDSIRAVAFTLASGYLAGTQLVHDPA